jgi:DHA2 family multidrug resistance protein
MLSLAVGALQLMLDRGSDKDWFNSTEIVVETGLAAAALWVFVVHTITDREPFIDKRLFMDRNFGAALILIFFIGIILLATMALLPPMLESNFGFPIITVGLVLAPRGIGTMASMLVVGRLVRKFDPRLLVGFGLTLTIISLYQMTYFSTDMTSAPVIFSGVIQGFGLGFVFIPLSTIAFITLDPKLRTDATSLFNLVRNLGSSIGVSIMAAALTANTQISHASLAAHITPFNPNLVASGFIPNLLTNPSGAAQLAELNGLITKQAVMIAYIDDFKLMFLITLCTVPLLFLLRYKPIPAGVKQESMAAAMAE